MITLWRLKIRQVAQQILCMASINWWFIYMNKIRRTKNIAVIQHFIHFMNISQDTLIKSHLLEEPLTNLSPNRVQTILKLRKRLIERFRCYLRPRRIWWIVNKLSLFTWRNLRSFLILTFTAPRFSSSLFSSEIAWIFMDGQKELKMKSRSILESQNTKINLERKLNHMIHWKIATNILK